jgi:hypothetical protein
MPTYSINHPQPLLHISQFSDPDQPAISCLIPATPRKPKKPHETVLEAFPLFHTPVYLRLPAAYIKHCNE